MPKKDKKGAAVPDESQKAASTSGSVSAAERASAGAGLGPEDLAMDPWRLWYELNPTTQTGQQQQQQQSVQLQAKNVITTVASLAECLRQEVELVSAQLQGGSLSWNRRLFKASEVGPVLNIEPYIGGGRWTVRVEVSQDRVLSFLTELVLSIVGGVVFESFYPAVAGVVLRLRTSTSKGRSGSPQFYFEVELWTLNTDTKESTGGGSPRLGTLLTSLCQDLAGKAAVSKAVFHVLREVLRETSLLGIPESNGSQSHQHGRSRSQADSPAHFGASLSVASLGSSTSSVPGFGASATQKEPQAADGGFSKDAAAKAFLESEQCATYQSQLQLLMTEDENLKKKHPTLYFQSLEPALTPSMQWVDCDPEEEGILERLRAHTVVDYVGRAQKALEERPTMAEVKKILSECRRDALAYHRILSRTISAHSLIRLQASEELDRGALSLQERHQFESLRKLKQVTIAEAESSKAKFAAASAEKKASPVDKPGKQQVAASVAPPQLPAMAAASEDVPAQTVSSAAASTLPTSQSSTSGKGKNAKNQPTSSVATSTTLPAPAPTPSVAAASPAATGPEIQKEKEPAPPATSAGKSSKNAAKPTSSAKKQPTAPSTAPVAPAVAEPTLTSAKEPVKESETAPETTKASTAVAGPAPKIEQQKTTDATAKRPVHEPPVEEKPTPVGAAPAKDGRRNSTTASTSTSTAPTVSGRSTATASRSTVTAKADELAAARKQRVWIGSWVVFGFIMLVLGVQSI